MSGITICAYAFDFYLCVFFMGGSISDVWLDSEQASEGDYNISTFVMIFEYNF